MYHFIRNIYNNDDVRFYYATQGLFSILQINIYSTVIDINFLKFQIDMSNKKNVISNI